MKFRTAILLLFLAATLLVLAYFSLVPGAPVLAADTHPAAKIISIASAPLAVKVLVALIALLFGITSLATFWKPGVGAADALPSERSFGQTPLYARR